MKALCKKYFTVRLHDHTKNVNELLNKIKFENHLTKLIIFVDQLIYKSCSFG